MRPRRPRTHRTLKGPPKTRSGDRPGCSPEPARRQVRDRFGGWLSRGRRWMARSRVSRARFDKENSEKDGVFRCLQCFGIRKKSFNGRLEPSCQASGFLTNHVCAFKFKRFRRYEGDLWIVIVPAISPGLVLHRGRPPWPRPPGNPFPSIPVQK